jgi:molybdopterin-guanine dinucleotide biosynthesis protein
MDRAVSDLQDEVRRMKDDVKLIEGYKAEVERVKAERERDMESVRYWSDRADKFEKELDLQRMEDRQKAADEAAMLERLRRAAAE